ncbi:uncharacterized protein MELLADRAFT_61514 [Melampsora larici-populina 98AG31]|uniref:Uncharacterized protein n=1 Tax=Melampsora larici-populina (strain 98AG31 / pathotype 3-4-7) TaxID=747676 RepID=F4RF79_MELLP|nr:uncharacterized protein MELLADRAFT_61514 [Melampsora larici-populina 98AG31]EGG08980.1 hypothetical protein MELLADRAFT_61514 [Melampsora larici-populina 98AG31]
MWSIKCACQDALGPTRGHALTPVHLHTLSGASSIGHAPTPVHLHTTSGASLIIPTQPQAPEPIVHISAPPHQPGYLSNRYQELLDAMQRLSTHTQTCLITRFLRDCEFAKDLETPALINPLSHSLATSSKTLDIPVSTQLQMKNSTTRPLKSPITHLSPLDKFVTPLSPSTFHPVKVASPTPAQSHDPPSHIDEATTNISEAPTTTTAKDPTPSNNEQANADADQALLEAINQTNIEKIMADDDQGVYHNLGVTSKEQEPTSEDLPAFDPYDSNAKNNQPELPKETHTNPRATSDNPIPNPDPALDLGPVLQQAPAPIKRGCGRKRKNTNTKTNKTSIDTTLISPHSSTSLSVPKPKKRKMPKGWVAIDEDDDSVNLEPNGDVEPPANPDPTPVPALASKASRGRKGKGKETPQIALRSSTRLNPVLKEVVSASQSPTPIAANSGATPISEPQDSLATTSTSIVLDREPDIRSTTSTTKTSRSMAKLKVST